MTNQFKTAFASLAVASLCTLGASSQASASDLLDAMLSGGKNAASCGCSQKSGGPVQRCGSKCGGKGVSGHAQRTSAGKGKSHVAHVQRSGSAKKGGGGQVQRVAAKKGRHVQRSTAKSGQGGSSKLSCHGVDLTAMMRGKMASMKCKLSSLCSRSKGKGKGGNKSVDSETGGAPLDVPAPRIREEIRNVPAPIDPDPSV
ncbi:MAG: hypothetical protein QGG09_20330 [Pirellulaceae bacterium]|nr:hypothetical protein [Pirellulaceae bacterium]HJN08900.1 hypothetical protein [Pirellulaceae bacterium]